MSDESFNLEAPGSRFTTHAAIAILSRCGRGDRYDPAIGDTGDPSEVVRDAFGATPLSDDALGQATVASGAVGRGASAWTPIVEWVFTVGIPAILTSAAWDATKAAGSAAARMVARLREREVEFLVSRGYAGLLAIEHLLAEAAEDGVLGVEAIQEPSSLSGECLTEVNYVGADPWIVLLLNEDRTQRYIVAVAPDGSVLGALGGQ
jgi:hypothetical protein